jgi:hypothetical protein
MERNSRKRLGVVAATTITVVASTIYFKDGAIFQDFPSNFLMLYCLEINGQNMITRISWIRLLATPNQSKDLNQLMDLFKRLKVIHKPTRFNE